MSQQRSAPAETIVIIIIGFLISVSDWANIMIGLVGLLLVIPPYLLPRFLFY
jgi:hypothetical protein